jgi:hypothetical protein
MTDLSVEFSVAELSEMFSFLDSLREAGPVNMFGATPFIVDEFGLDEEIARKVLTSWMQTFDDKVRPAQRASEVLK